MGQDDNKKRGTMIIDLESESEVDLDDGSRGDKKGGLSRLVGQEASAPPERRKRKIIDLEDVSAVDLITDLEDVSAINLEHESERGEERGLSHLVGQEASAPPERRKRRKIFDLDDDSDRGEKRGWWR